MNIDYSETTQYLEWLKEKLWLNNNATNAQKRIVYRGDVYECNLGVGIGSEERKKRPCVVLQNNTGNKFSGLVLVAPISHSARVSPVVIPIADKKDASGNIILDGYVLVGNMTSVSKARLGNKISKLDKKEMEAVDQAVIVQTGLLDKFNTLNNIIADKDKYIAKLKEEKSNS